MTTLEALLLIAKALAAVGVLNLACYYFDNKRVQAHSQNTAVNQQSCRLPTLQWESESNRFAKEQPPLLRVPGTRHVDRDSMAIAQD